MIKQKILDRSLFMVLLVYSGLVVLGSLGLVSAQEGSMSFEGYYLHLGDHPSDADPSWAEDVQGISHDNAYWYITRASEHKYTSGDPEGELWKIPVSVDLSSVSHSTPGVQVTSTQSISGYDAGYWHMGGQANYEYNGVGYILVPVEDGSRPPIISVFKTSDLAYLGQVIIPQTKAGWVAIDPQGYVYSGSSHNSYEKYNFSWEQIGVGSLSLGYLETVPFYDMYGNQIDLQNSPQGGVFSSSGELFYITTGFFDEPKAWDGISVFNTTTHKMVAHSTNTGYPFDYYLNQGSPSYNEAEGLTIWDLGDTPSAGTGNAFGQLHVLMLDNDLTDEDEVYLRHYTNTLYVDSGYPGGTNLRNGRPATPYNTIREAYNTIDSFSYGAQVLGWDGARIRIRAGTYPESYPGSLVFDKQIQLFSEGGTARIRSRAALSPNGIINIGKSGEMKVY